MATLLPSSEVTALRFALRFSPPTLVLEYTRGGDARKRVSKFQLRKLKRSSVSAPGRRRRRRRRRRRTCCLIVCFAMCAFRYPRRPLWPDLVAAPESWLRPGFALASSRLHPGSTTARETHHIRDVTRPSPSPPALLFTHSPTWVVHHHVIMFPLSPFCRTRKKLSAVCSGNAPSILARPSSPRSS